MANGSRLKARMIGTIKFIEFVQLSEFVEFIERLVFVGLYAFMGSTSSILSGNL